MDTQWRSYEEVARYLLDQFKKEFGLSEVQRKQSVHGFRSYTDWEIDAKGIREDNGSFVIIECRAYKSSKQKQKDMAALAYTIQDTGAFGGIIVSPLGLQEGAQKIAKAEDIVNVQLNADCTTEEFVIKFLNKIKVGRSYEISIPNISVEVKLFNPCKECGKKFEVKNNEQICPECQGMK